MRLAQPLPCVGHSGDERDPIGVTLIQWKKMGKKMGTTLTIPGAAELDAITTDPALNRVYVTDESLASLWILKDACANGVGVHCAP